MFGSRLHLSIAVVIASVVPVLADGPGIFNRKSRVDPARVRQLTTIVRAESDEKKRKAAVMELAEIDPRVNVDVIPALITVLRRDGSAPVRAAAADAIGRFNVIFPIAGVALEEALESDASPEVRGAARSALWEYHLIGYRSARAADSIAGQTAEPPLARPAAAPVAYTAEPPTAIAPASTPTPTIAPLPPVGVPPGPRVNSPVMPKPAAVPGLNPPHPNLTVEPPLARSKSDVAPLPLATTEPPIRPRAFEPVSIVKRPTIAHDLPPIVAPPGETPIVLPKQTSEPPLSRPPTRK